MGKLYINGTLSPIPKPAEVDFDPVRGIVVTQESHGAGVDSLAGLANFYRATGVAFKWKRGAVSTIVATYSGGQGGIQDAPQTNYELLGNEIQKHVFESGLASAAEQRFPGTVSIVRRVFAAMQSGEITDEESELNGFLGFTMSEDQRGYYKTLLGFLMRGQTHFAQGQYVLKCSTSISNFYAGNITGESCVERLISTETLLTWCYDMPLVMSQKISSIPGPASTHPDHAWGWRQLPSRMVTSAMNRVELSTEWWLEEWSTQIYGDLL